MLGEQHSLSQELENAGSINYFGHLKFGNSVSVNIGGALGILGDPSFLFLCLIISYAAKLVH
jgi:tRNA(Glu) U13 pseudouridine synthase TruD